MAYHRIDLSLILPCYNEAPIFAGSIKRILSVLDGLKYSYEVIFVDDGSKDGTVPLIKYICKKNRKCHAVFHSSNQGRGKAVKDGFLLAKGTAVGYIDIDCEVSPVYIPEMVDRIIKKEVDGIIGNRIYRSTVGSIVREILSIGYQKIADFLIGTNGLDTESGYKFFNRKKILPVLVKTRHPHWFWDTEIVVFGLRAGLDIVQEPVLFIRRTDKKSSVVLISDVIDYLTNIWLLRGRLGH